MTLLVLADASPSIYAPAGEPFALDVDPRSVRASSAPPARRGMRSLRASTFRACFTLRFVRASTLPDRARRGLDVVSITYNAWRNVAQRSETRCD